MPHLDDLALARTLHVAAIVHWIGGLWLVSLVILADRAPSEAVLARFLAVERRFAPQARLSVLLAGASGLWLTARLDLWWRFAEPAFWWMHGMVGLWLLFALLLFGAEPLFLHRGFDRLVAREPDRALRLARRGHLALAILAALVILGTVAGAHG